MGEEVAPSEHQHFVKPFGNGPLPRLPLNEITPLRQLGFSHLQVARLWWLHTAQDAFDE